MILNEHNSLQKNFKSRLEVDSLSGCMLHTLVGEEGGGWHWVGNVVVCWRNL